METPLDVLSRAASFVHANEEEGKSDSICSGVFWLRRCTTNHYAIFSLAFVAIRFNLSGSGTKGVFVKYEPQV